MSFKPFGEAVQLRFMEMSEGELYVVEADDIFERYLAAFPEGSNPMFRQRTEHDCVCCKQFVRRLGVVVAIKDNELVTVWGGLDIQGPYKVVADALDAYVRSKPIVSVFRTDQNKYGNSHTYEKATNTKWDHFVGDVSKKHCVKDPDTQRGELSTNFQLAKRSLTELRATDVDQVLELIDSNGLYKGEENRKPLTDFRNLMWKHKEAKNKDLFIWENLSNKVLLIRNTSIGTLLQDLAEGKDLEDAVKAFEFKVAPTNYKRTTSVITQKMVEQAVGKLHSLGLAGALQRRFARMSDVSAQDVLFVSNEAQSKMKDGITALLESSIKKPTPNLKNAEPKTIQEFLENILPGSKTVHAFVENRHAGNFVSLTGADGPERLFPWDNNFAWAYDGDVTDSVKQRVKAAGGNIHADLRISLSWFNTDDLDLHCQMPGGYHIHYANKIGILDVDMNAFHGLSRNPVENLAFMKPKDGVYKIWVNQFNRRETTDFGFAIEIECNGVLHQYSHAAAMGNKTNVQCFDITMKAGRIEKIETALAGGMTSQDKWGIKTESLVPVSAIMFSPNHWGENKVGAKHVIFALEGCKNPESVRGIFNEYLKPDLIPHRKVFEVLGSKTKCKPTDDQISGVGFTAARGDSINVVVDGGRSYLLSF